MDALTRLARPDILALAPYSSARTEGEQDMRVFVDANENPHAPHPGGPAEEGLNRYPSPQPPELLDLFAGLYGVPRERLLLSRGADEGIDLLVRAFCAAREDAIVVCPPTFAMYEMAAAIQGAGVHRVPLRKGETFDLDVDGVLAACAGDPGAKLVFACTPNNPTGGLLRREDVLATAEALLGKALVVADETYVEFTGRPSLAADIDAHPNLVVLRTVSKDFGLAGERCGITVAHPAVIDLLGRILAPYPLTATSVRSVAAALTPEGVAVARERMAGLVAERERIEAALAPSPAVVRIYPSDANFLLVEVRDAARLVAEMAAAGIKVRDRSKVPGIEGCVRFSVGTPAENDDLLDVFAKHAV
jgi:histidinol-phosphate aminotransferase